MLLMTYKAIAEFYKLTEEQIDSLGNSISAIRQSAYLETYDNSADTLKRILYLIDSQSSDLNWFMDLKYGDDEEYLLAFELLTDVARVQRFELVGY